MQQKFQGKKSIYWLIIIFFSAFFVLWILVISPSFKKIRSISDRILSARVEAALLADQADNLTGFKKTYENLQSHIEKVSRQFVDYENPVEFVRFMETIAQNMNIDFKVTLYANEKDLGQKASGPARLQIQASGAFADLFRFYEKLEHGPYLLDFRKIVFKRYNKGEGLPENDLQSQGVQASLLAEIIL